MGQRTGIDVAMIVVSSLMLVLTLSLYAAVGAMLNLDYIVAYVSCLQLGIASWYLLTSVLGIASGASGHKCPYVSVIVLSVLAIFVSLAGCVLAGLTAFAETFRDVDFYATTIMPDIHQLITDTVRKLTYSEQAQQFISSLPIGVLIINGISFIMLIVLSSIACCGTCCNTRRMPVQQHATYITTSAGYTTTATVPPGYIGQPPQHDFQGMSNPNYDTPQANIALTDKVAYA